MERKNGTYTGELILSRRCADRQYLKRKAAVVHETSVLRKSVAFWVTRERGILFERVRDVRLQHKILIHWRDRSSGLQAIAGERICLPKAHDQIKVFYLPSRLSRTPSAEASPAGARDWGIKTDRHSVPCCSASRRSRNLPDTRCRSGGLQLQRIRRIISLLSKLEHFLWRDKH